MISDERHDMDAPRMDQRLNSIFIIFRKILHCFFIFLSTLTVSGSAASISDPHLWLENSDSEKTKHWVYEQNLRTVFGLESQIDFNRLHSVVSQTLWATRQPNQVYLPYLDHTFWTHVLAPKSRGKIFKANAPTAGQELDWKLVIDFDEVLKDQPQTMSWQYYGELRFASEKSRRLVFFHEQGKDEKILKEFDYDQQQVVLNGFELPAAKTKVEIINKNQILVVSSLAKKTKAHFGRQIKLWTRGESFDRAPVIFEVSQNDSSVSSFSSRTESGKRVIIFLRHIDYFRSEYYYWIGNDVQLSSSDFAPHTIRKLDLPSDVSLLAFDDNRFFFHSNSKLSLRGVEIPKNSIFEVEFSDLAKLDRSDSSYEARLICSLQPRDSIGGFSVENKNNFYFVLHQNVSSRLFRIRRSATQTNNISFSVEEVQGLPDVKKDEFRTISIYPKNNYQLQTEVIFSSFLNPPRRFHLEGEKIYERQFFSSFFQDSFFEVIQNYAKSKDGTSVPYFVIKSKQMPYNGLNSTILTGYGGFQNSLTPQYDPVMGKAWLESGGVYVVANIRGGGEFGNDWHKAAILHNRKKSFEDFAAVAQDLVTRKITSPARLGLAGASNGGLLVGAMVAHYPELFSAAYINVPLLDMVRYVKLGGGSWIAEYGDPGIKKDCEYLLSYSPYHNLKQNQRYPFVFLTTSSTDDRVHPAHARKMAQRLFELKSPYFFYEHKDGGHADLSSFEQSVRRETMKYVFFSRYLLL